MNVINQNSQLPITVILASDNRSRWEFRGSSTLVWAHQVGGLQIASTGKAAGL
jgi:hypothetical protein